MRTTRPPTWKTTQLVSVCRGWALCKTTCGMLLLHSLGHVCVLFVCPLVVQLVNVSRAHCAGCLQVPLIQRPIVVVEQYRRELHEVGVCLLG